MTTKQSPSAPTWKRISHKKAKAMLARIFGAKFVSLLKGCIPESDGVNVRFRVKACSIHNYSITAFSINLTKP